MSDFWTSELGAITGSPADAFARIFTHIPDGTMALARIDSFINNEYMGNRFLNLRWILTDGDFKGAQVDQKIKVFGDSMAKDPAKARHRALNMLKLIYQLYNVKPTHSGDPTDKDLAIFHGKIAGIKIGEIISKDNGNQYNWIAEIHSAKDFKCETGVSVVVTHTNVSNNSQGNMDSAFNRQSNLSVTNDMDEDIPF